MSIIVDFVVCESCGGDQYRLNGNRTFKGDTCTCKIKTLKTLHELQGRPAPTAD